MIMELKELWETTRLTKTPNETFTDLAKVCGYTDEQILKFSTIEKLYLCLSKASLNDKLRIHIGDIISMIEKNSVDTLTIVWVDYFLGYCEVEK